MSWFKKWFGKKEVVYVDPKTYPPTAPDVPLKGKMEELPKASYQEVRSLVEEWTRGAPVSGEMESVQVNCAGLRVRLYRTTESFEVFVYDGAGKRRVGFFTNWYAFPVDPKILMAQMDETLGIALATEISNE